MGKLLVLASFAFVLSMVSGQGYIGRSRPIKKPVAPILPKPKPLGVMDPLGMDPLGMDPLGMDPMGMQVPLDKLIGSTITGNTIIGGQGLFPKHGGAGRGEAFKDGLRNGWGVDPNAPMHQSVSAWVDPLDNRPWDPAFNGGELIWDDARGMYVAKQIHHQAKKTGAIMGPSIGAEHGMMKQAAHMADKTVGGLGIAEPIGTAFINPTGPIAMEHQIVKSSGIGGIGMGGGPIIHHDIAKTSSIGHGIGGIGLQHDIAKSTSVIGGPGAHHIAKSGGMVGLGMNGIGLQHDIAKSGGMVGAGIGGIGLQHDIAKATSIGVDPYGAPIGVQHDIAKATSVFGPGPVVGVGGGYLPPVQTKKAGPNPVHNVEKVIRSGVTSLGHDDLAFNLGSQLAREVTHNAAKTIDMGSGGAVSMGNHVANKAVAGLASEAMHIAQETVGLAANKPGHLGSHGIMSGGPIVGLGGVPMVGGGSHLIGAGGIGMIDTPLLPQKPLKPKVLPGGGYGAIRSRGRGRGRGLALGLRTW